MSIGSGTTGAAGSMLRAGARHNCNRLAAAGFTARHVRWCHTHHGPVPCWSGRTATPSEIVHSTSDGT